jgi:hypothetical protein
VLVETFEDGVSISNFLMDPARTEAIDQAIKKGKQLIAEGGVAGSVAAAAGAAARWAGSGGASTAGAGAGAAAEAGAGAGAGDTPVNTEVPEANKILAGGLLGTDVELPPAPPHVYMCIHPDSKSCGPVRNRFKCLIAMTLASICAFTLTTSLAGTLDIGSSGYSQ